MVKYKDNWKRFDCPDTTNWVGLRIMMEEDEDGDYVFYDAARHEIEQCLQVITELTHEKYQALCDVDNLQARVAKLEVKARHPLGICDDHIKGWNRVECPLCDVLFLYERLKLALEVIDDAVCLLSEMPEVEPGVDDEEKDEANRGMACINLSKFLEYAQIGMSGETCNCDEAGEGRCAKHGWETFAASLRWAKKGKGA